MIKKRTGELAIQLSEAVDPLFFVEMNDRFDIGTAPKAMSPVFERGAEFAVIENFAVADHDDRPVLVLEWLIAMLQVDDAQTTKT